ncbi:MAG TPA: hypothetical protein V6C76_01570 [Drouetiella sp.]
MKFTAILPAAALLVLLVPSSAFSKNYDNYNNLVQLGPAQAGSLTPFSTVSTPSYLSGGVNQFSNGYDPLANNFAQGQLDVYGNPVPYTGNVNINNLAAGAMSNHHQCNSPRRQLERALQAQGIDPMSIAYSSGYNSALNNPAINPFANPYANGYNNVPYGNPYANGAMPNPNMNPYMNGSANLPYGYPNAGAYQNANLNPYLTNGMYNGNPNSFINNATSASNLSRLGSVLSGSGLGNLGNYASNGNLNGGSLSSLRGLLGI